MTITQPANTLYQKSARTNMCLMTKRHNYEKPYNQSTVLSNLKEMTSYLFAGWTQNVCSAEAVSGLHKYYNRSQFSKVKT